MAVESLPVEFIAYTIYDYEIARKTIVVELASEYPDTLFDLTTKEHLKSFVADVAEIYGMHLYEAEVDLILKDLQPLNPDATREEVKEFIAKVFKGIVDYREYVDRVNTEIQGKVYGIEVEIPHYNWKSLLFLMRDRCHYLKDCYRADKEDETCRRYFKDLMILEKEIDGYDLSRFPNDIQETIKDIRNTIIKVSNKLNSKTKINKKWLKEKLSELCNDIDVLKK